MQAAETAHLIDSVLAAGGQSELAWQELLARVHRAARAVSAKRYPRHGEDFAYGVALRTVERLRKSGYRALKRFVETKNLYPDMSFDAWLHTLIRNSAVDEIRALPQFSRQSTDQGRVLVRRLHVPFEDQTTTGGTESWHRNIEARRVLEWIHDPEFPEDQRQAVLLWLNGHDHEEIADIMSLSLLDVSRVLRAARQRLRRRFQVTP